MVNESNEEEVLDLREIWGVLVRGRWYILLSFVLIVGLTGLYTFTAEEVYQSEAKIMQEASGGSGEGITSLLENPLSGLSSRNALQNKKEILTSTPVLEAAVEKLRDNQTYLQERRKEASSNSLLGGLFKSTGLAKDNSTPDSSELVTAGHLRNNMSVSTIPDTDIIQVKMKGSSPGAAKIATNALLDAFKEQQLKTAQKDVSKIKNFLKQQLEEMKKRVENTEKEAIQFRNKTGLVLGQAGLENNLSQLQKMLAQAQVEYQDKQDELKTINKMLDTVKQDLFEEDLVDGGQTAVNEFQDKYFQLKKLKNEIEELEEERSQYLEEDNYAKAEQLEQQIKDKRKKFQGSATEKFQVLDLLPKYEELIKRQLEVSVEVEAAENRVQVLRKKIDGLIDQLTQHGLELLRYERDLDVTKETYKMLRTEYEKARITEAGELGGVRVVARGSTPKAPIEPNKKRNMLLAVVLGLAVGSGLAFVKEYLDNSIRGPEDVESLGISSLGTVIYIEHETDSKGVEDLRNTLVTQFGPQSPAVDAYATLEANIRFLELDEPLNSLLVTSSLPGEGKTTTAINLGLTMAEMGKDVLVIDVDFRNPFLGKVFDLGEKEGLTELALEEVTAEEVIRRPYVDRGRPVGRSLKKYVLERDLISEAKYEKIEQRGSEETGDRLVSKGYLTEEELQEIKGQQREGLEGFHVLSSGKLPPNPAAFFNSDRWSELLTALEERFDLVLLDSPPVTAAPDTSIVSAEVDGTMLVIAVDETEINVLEDAQRQLDSAGALLVGGVLNKLHTSR
ncbi:AAA family ATPase, partial [Candidatus Bipolaricaulota bacterium]|nr:AAA family ATPase [Candidatus Bipolaricaulota bacterium]